MAYSFEVNSVREVIDEINRTARRGDRIAYMDFHTHGGPGVISLGDEPLLSWRRHFGPGFDAIFSSNARIEFHGCSVAEGVDGEAFLAECAWTFLRTNGGTVLGSAWFQFALPRGSVPLSPGTWVTAEIARGGAVWLRNATHLIPTRLRREHETLASWYRQTFSRRRVALTEGEVQARLGRLLGGAGSLLVGRPSYRDMARAARKLESVNRTLRRLDPLGAQPTFGW